MKLCKLQVNHQFTPLGYEMRHSTFSYQACASMGTFLEKHQIEIATDPDFTHLIYTNTNEETNVPMFFISLDYLPRTRYYWRVKAWDNQGANAEAVSWFETGKLEEAWQGKWITPVNQELPAPKLKTQFNVSKEVKQARLYLCGLGVYEASLNQKKIGDEFFTPGYNNYDEWIQYQTYDVTDDLVATNELDVLLGKGWYLGNFGFHGGRENIYGDQLALIAELHIEYVDGTNEIIASDEKWLASDSAICENSIYYGEDLDETKAIGEAEAVQLATIPRGKLTERLSVPVKVMEEKEIEAILEGEECLFDMGQNMVGWLTFFNVLPKGVTVRFDFAETLVDGAFYRENLREARAAFVYTSDGNSHWVRPHFSFFGFRYVKVTGWPKDIPFSQAQFRGEVLYSEMTRTGTFKTSHEKVNRLYDNIVWSQKGNFLEVPTDCPQRDERMGWTGDAQIFSKTAMYNYDAATFFLKYGQDMWTEQINHGGAPTMTIPNVPSDMGKDSVAAGIWGDAATIIPWNVYQMTGDRRLLQMQFESMKAWVDYIASRSFVNGLWAKDFQFGDWLALDGEDPRSPMGGTEEAFVANTFYLHSLEIVAKTARILGVTADEKAYQARHDALKEALKNEYFTPNGRLAIDTQTGYALALHFDLINTDQRPAMVEKLRQRLEKDQYHLKTGFVGTPFLNLALSENGLDEIAYTLLLNEDYPSWLYAVNLGATSIWERWNSVLPDGTMNPQGMNSLNHYAYGAIGQWFFEYVLGIQELQPGFSEVQIAPHIHGSLHEVKGSYQTLNGTIAVAWQVSEDNQVLIQLEVPFNTRAKVVLPFISEEELARQVEYQVGETELTLARGTYTFTYQATTTLVRKWDAQKTTLDDLLSTPLIASRLQQQFADSKFLSDVTKHMHRARTLEELVTLGVMCDTEFTEVLALLKEIRG